MLHQIAKERGKMIEHKYYKEDILYVAELPVKWNLIQHKKVLIAGATGMLGTFLVDVLMYKNKVENLDCDIILLGRDSLKAEERFKGYFGDKNFHFYTCDINNTIDIEVDKVDYVIHGASNTHPMLYSTEPIETIITNVLGTKNLLDFAKKHETDRVLFLSSVEVYGENRGDCEYFAEDYCGYINCNTLRAGYTEGKRVGEALCQAYIKQENLDIVIPRLARIYGPTMLKSDSKALSQFIKKAVQGEDIILKSEGNQFFSYCYVADAIAGIIYCWLHGKCGEAYNISDVSSDITLKKLANRIASEAGKKVIFELPSETEKAGYSKATKAVLDSSKLHELGWKAKYTIETGVQRTIKMLKDNEVSM